LRQTCSQIVVQTTAHCITTAGSLLIQIDHTYAFPSQILNLDNFVHCIIFGVLPCVPFLLYVYFVKKCDKREKPVFYIKIFNWCKFFGKYTVYYIRHLFDAQESKWSTTPPSAHYFHFRSGLSWQLGFHPCSAKKTKNFEKIFLFEIEAFRSCRLLKQKRTKICRDSVFPKNREILLSCF